MVSTAHRLFATIGVSVQNEQVETPTRKPFQQGFNSELAVILPAEKIGRSERCQNELPGTRLSAEWDVIIFTFTDQGLPVLCVHTLLFFCVSPYVNVWVSTDKW